MSKTVKDVIEKRGYGDYTINVSEYVRITFDMGRTNKYQVKVIYNKDGFLTKSPSVLDYILDNKNYSISIFKESNYTNIKSKTDRFEVVIGVNEGYFHNNETTTNIYELWKKYANEIEQKHGIYISALISESKVVYKDEWGCPKGDGELIYRITGERNTKFIKNSDKYKYALEDLMELLAKKLKQTTFTISWSEVELGYYEKVVE